MQNFPCPNTYISIVKWKNSGLAIVTHALQTDQQCCATTSMVAAYNVPWKCHSSQPLAIYFIGSLYYSYTKSTLATNTRVARPHFSARRYRYKCPRCFSPLISSSTLAFNKCGH